MLSITPSCYDDDGGTPPCSPRPQPQIVKTHGNAEFCHALPRHSSSHGEVGNLGRGAGWLSGYLARILGDFEGSQSDPLRHGETRTVPPAPPRDPVQPPVLTAMAPPAFKAFFFLLERNAAQEKGKVSCFQNALLF